MRHVRAIILGIIIWIIGASFYMTSYFIPILEDEELQANLALAIAIAPLAWFGGESYYKKETRMHGVKLALIMLSTSITLDAIVTVPYFIVPYGGSYKSFYSSPAFWLLAMEYLLVVYSYWHIKVKPKSIVSAL